MGSGACLIFLIIISTAALFVDATDPSQLQDFCVGTNDPYNALFVNGMFCKNPANVTADDFYKTGLHIPGNTNNLQGFNVTPIFATQLPGLNTLGISLVRIDYAPSGQNPPHTHPRATEILTLLHGTLHVGFVLSNSPNGNKLFTKTLYKGDVFVFPQGLIHFQFNPNSNKPAVAIAALSSQDPGVVTIANAVFGSTPPIEVDVLSKAFQLNGGDVQRLQATFGKK